MGFLYESPNHGYNLHQLLESQLGHVWHIRQSQTYAILKRLEAQGYVSSTLLEQEKLPPRQLLSLTERGRERFLQWLEAPSGSSVRAVRLDFITRLYFASRLFPQRLHSMFSTQSAEVELALERLQKALAAIPQEQVFNRLGLELRIRQLGSICDWLEDCRRSFGILEP